MTRRSLLPVSLALAGLLAGCGEPPKLVPPSMELSGTALDFSAAVGGNAPAAQTLTITHLGGGSLSTPTTQVTYQGSGGWLSSVAVTGGPASYTLTVQPSPGSLAAGTYTASIRVSSVSAVNSPLTVAVTLEVAAATVVITRHLTSWAEDGTSATSPATDVTSVTLLEDDGAGGTRPTVLTASGAGSWSGSVSRGSWVAEVLWADGHRAFVPGSGTSLDLGEDLGGRADRVEATGVTLVSPDLNGLELWEAINDQLIFYAWGAQALAVLATSNPADFPLNDDATSLTGYDFDWQPVGALLAPADVLHAVQYRNRQKVRGTKLLDYQRAVAATSMTGLTQVDKTKLTLPAATLTSFLDVTAPTLNLSWQRLAFQAASPPYATTLAPTGHHLGVYATPAPLTTTAPLAAAGLPLLSCTDPGQEDDDINAGPVEYARLQPAGWHEFVLTRYASAVVRNAPGATVALAEAQNRVYRYDAVAAAPASFVPLVGAPRSPTIAGQDALAGTLLTGVSRTATLAWQPPASGTPTSYRVAVKRLSAVGTTSVAAPVADFVVGGGTTTLQLPVGLLAGSTTYVATIAARSSPTDAGGTTPYRIGVPFGEGLLWTVPFTTVP